MTDKQDWIKDAVEKMLDWMIETDRRAGGRSTTKQQSDVRNCLTRLIREAYAEQEKEIATLRAAIATPEVYAGVITKVVETERDWALKQLQQMIEAAGEMLSTIQRMAKEEGLPEEEVPTSNQIENWRRAIDDAKKEQK